MIEEYVADKRRVEMKDTGELQFTYSIKMSKRNEIIRTLDFKLKEMEIGDLQKLSIKLDRLEAENK
jgi:hypothetical protein